MDLTKRLQEDWVWVQTFIKDLHTWKELYSKHEWQFVSWKKCFIDDTRYYCRLWWIEWVDYEIVKKPIEFCIQRWSRWKSWQQPVKYKFIWNLSTRHIVNILKTQKYISPALTELLNLVLKSTKK